MTEQMYYCVKCQQYYSEHDERLVIETDGSTRCPECHALEFFPTRSPWKSEELANGR